MTEHIINAASVLDALSRHIGEARGATAAELVQEIVGCPADDGMRRLRKIIEDLRRRGNHICAHPRTGYFIAANAAELDRTCEYLYDRALCSLTQVAAMRRVSLPDLRGQLRLPD